MKGGFSFCGVDVGTFGLEYVPEQQQTYVFGSSQYAVSEQSFEGHDGGVFYGTTVKPKDFTLRCIYQGSNINEGILTKVTRFFSRGRTGKLVFSKRDWVWYSATVISVDTSRITNYMNGMVTITMRAYYPFGRHDQLFLNDDYPNYGNKTRNSGLLLPEQTPMTTIVPADRPLTSEKSFLLYNGGTETACVSVEIAGDFADGVIIENRTTGQSCKFVALTAALSSDIGKHIACDALNGKTIMVDETDATKNEYCYLYHDNGFITLKPSFPIDRDIQIRYFDGDSHIHCDGFFNETHVGKYVWLCGAWHKINAIIDDSTAEIDSEMMTSGVAFSSIVTMNELCVRPISSMKLTMLKFVYKPTFE